MMMTTTMTMPEDYTTHPLYERQIALEAEMVSRGALAYQRKELTAKAAGQESTTKSGAYLMRRAIKPVADAIEAFLAKAGDGSPGRRHAAVAYLRQVSPDIAAFIALRTCLNYISTKATLQNLAVTIGTSLETEVRLAVMEKENIDEYRKASHVVRKRTNETHKRIIYTYIARANNIDVPRWPTKDRLHVGQKLLEIVEATTGYIKIVTDKKSTPAKKAKTRAAYTYHIVGTLKTLDWIDKMNNYAELASPEYFPCIMPPRPWTDPYNGGYYSQYKPLKLVKRGTKNYMEELSLMVEDMPVLYEAINAMQATGYTINRPVFEVMTALWEGGGDVAGIPNRDTYALPRCPLCGVEVQKRVEGGPGHPCFDDKEVFKRWKKDAKAIHAKNAITLAQRFQFAKTLYIAGRFKDEAAIYFPMQLDFRGRCYAVPSFLNPQGADPAKGLLQFAEAKPIETDDAVLWLTIQGANTWGNDKVSLDERRAWVFEHEQEILAVAANPYEHRMWFEADKPWQFLAFCFEWSAYKAALAMGSVFYSHLPVAMDGTCNGLQIFSLLLRDPVGGEATNLLPSERPRDIYKIVADKVLEKLKEKIDNGATVYQKNKDEVWYHEPDLASRLVKMGINRKTTKRQVMVLPYGGTFHSCHEYTLEHLSERLGGGEAGGEMEINPDNVYAASFFLARLIWDAIGETVVAARKAMGYLQELAALAAASDLPVNWTTPIGFLVSQTYYNYKEYRVETRLGASTVRLTLKDEGEVLSLDRRRQRNGISPNFVHSLDAAAMMASISLARKEGVSSFMMVHDSYGTHAADAAIMARCLRTAFVEMFTERNVLEDLQNSVSAMLPKTLRKRLPKLPEPGDLDITQVLQSTFFFA